MQRAHAKQKKNKNITKMVQSAQEKNTRFYSFSGSFNPVSPERLRSWVFPASGIPLASSPKD